MMAEQITNADLSDAIKAQLERAMDNDIPMPGYDAEAQTLVVEVPEKGWVKLTGFHIKSIDMGMPVTEEVVKVEQTISFDEIVQPNRGDAEKWYQEVMGRPGVEVPLYPSPCCGEEGRPEYLGGEMTRMHCPCGKRWTP